MNVKEILNRLTVHDIERAMLSFEDNPYDRGGIKDKYTLIHNEKEYPGRELIMRASNEELNTADNPSSYTTFLAKQKLIELGFSQRERVKIRGNAYPRRFVKRGRERQSWQYVY